MGGPRGGKGGGTAMGAEIAARPVRCVCGLGKFPAYVHVLYTMYTYNVYVSVICILCTRISTHTHMRIRTYADTHMCWRMCC
jgi:hypothetical protein